MIRVFLDNNGISFKTVAIQKDTTIHELAGLVAKKIFDDTTGFGIWEVKDKLGRKFHIWCDGNHVL